MRLKLVKKFANVIKGVDLTNIAEGAVVVVTPQQAAILVAEGWAEATPRAPGTMVMNLQPSSKS